MAPIIWDLDVIAVINEPPSIEMSKTLSSHPSIGPDDIMPLSKLEKCQCPCVGNYKHQIYKPPQAPNIQTAVQELCISSSSDSENDDAKESDDYDLTLDENKGGSYAQDFKIAGSCMEQIYQQNLELLREHMLQSRKKVKPVMENVLIEAVLEPENPVDRNAIAFYGSIKKEDKMILGYCPLPKIPKLFHAVNNNEINSAVISVPTYTHYGKPGFRATITLVKSHKWLPDDKKNKYNSTLSA